MSDEWTVAIEKPVTREKAATAMRRRAANPDTVVEVVHPGFNADLVCGGFAFASERELLLVSFDGGHTLSIEMGDHDAQLASIERWWRQTQHRNRAVGLDEISDWHRAAIAALVGGYDSVAELPAEQRPGVSDPAVANYLLAFLHLLDEPTQQAALRALASADWLLEPPREHDRAHPCPVCGRPAIGEDWGYVSVCFVCCRKAACPHNRIVTGSTESGAHDSWARHADDDTVCEAVTRSGIVAIDGRECHMGEASLGGIFVGALPPAAE